MTKEDVLSDVAKEIAKDVYTDAGKAVMKPTGELISLVPRAVKAALLPLEQWILQREFTIEKTRLLLEEKLKNVPPEQIQPPEPHVAVPALQYLGYCLDNEELRDMYANLLANSMNTVVKNGVHPGFVEIIKQLCPDEAKILRYLSTHKIIPTITLRFDDEKGYGTDIVKHFSNVGELAKCEEPFDFKVYFDNMIRLGLLESSPQLASMTDKSLYEPLKNHPKLHSEDIDIMRRAMGKNKATFIEGYMKLTHYGHKFCDICVSKTVLPE